MKKSFINSLKRALMIHRCTKRIIGGSKWCKDNIKGVLCSHCFSRGKLCRGHNIPKDVPKGHLAVYVGGDEEGSSRYVVDISVLGHPCFQVLLDQAAEVFEFSTAAKLCIPCNEAMFLRILSLCSGSKRSIHQVSCFSVIS